MRHYFYAVLFFIFLVTSVANGNIGFADFAEKGANFREELRQNNPEDLKKAYRELEVYFFSNSSKASLMDWSTFVELTKNYSSCCLKLADFDTAARVLTSLLAKKPPEIFVAEISFLLHGLNPSKDSREVVTSKLRRLLYDDPSLVYSSENHLLVTAYETLTRDYFDDLYRQINTDFHLENYTGMRVVCEEALRKVGSEDIIPSNIVEVVTADLERLLRKAELYDVMVDRIDTDDGREEKIKKYIAYLNASSVYLNKEEEMIGRLCKQELLRNIYVDRMLLQAGKRWLTIDSVKGKLILESLIDGGFCIRSGPTRDALLSLLNAYFRSNDCENIRRLVKLTEENLCIGDPLLGDLIFYKGWLSYKDDNFSVAIGEFEKILRRTETIGIYTPSVLLILGEIFLRQALEALKAGYNPCFDLAQAERYFLSSYKNWSRGEGALGYLVTLFLRVGTPSFESHTAAERFLKENFHKFSYLEKSLCRSFVELFLRDLRDDFIGVGSFFSRETALYRLMCIHKDKSLENLTIEKEIIKFLFKSPIQKKDSLINLFQDIVDWKLSFDLSKIASEVNPDSIWSLLHRIKSKGISLDGFQNEISLSSCSASLKEALKAYSMRMSLSSGKLNEFNPPIFWNISELLGYGLICSDCDIRCITDTGLTDMDYRLLGEEFYFKTYPHFSYLNRNVEANSHLKRFPDFFPYSELLPVVLFFLGAGEVENTSALNYLADSLSFFDTVSLNPHKNDAYAYFYYRTCFEYASRLLESHSLENIYRAISVLEELKERNQVGFFDFRGDSLALERNGNLKTLIRLLIIGYGAVFEEDYLYRHIFEYSDRIATERELLDWVLINLNQLGTKFSTIS